MLFRFWSLSQALLSTFPSVFLLMQRHSHCLYQLQMEGFLSRGFHLWLYDRIQRRRWHPTPVLLPGKPHGRRSLVGCSPRGHKESDTTERLHFNFSLLCIGEGNGNPLLLPGESQGRGSLVGCCLWGRTESDTVKRLSSSRRVTRFILAVKWAFPTLSRYLFKKKVKHLFSKKND